MQRNSDGGIDNLSIALLPERGRRSVLFFLLVKRWPVSLALLAIFRTIAWIGYTWLGNINAASVFSEEVSYYSRQRRLASMTPSRIYQIAYHKRQLINEKHNLCTEDIHCAELTSGINASRSLYVLEENCVHLMLLKLRSLLLFGTEIVFLLWERLLIFVFNTGEQASAFDEYHVAPLDPHQVLL